MTLIEKLIASGLVPAEQRKALKHVLNQWLWQQYNDGHIEQISENTFKINLEQINAKNN